MELRFQSGLASKEDRRSRRPVILALALVTVLFFAAEWFESGAIVTSATAVVAVLLVPGILIRVSRLGVVADGSGVTATNWFSRQTWSWDTIAAFDYVPRDLPSARSAGQFYTGIVTLTDGGEHSMSALGGSSEGTRATDERNRSFIAELNAALSTYKNHGTTIGEPAAAT